jgi:hypothetical protein
MKAILISNSDGRVGAYAAAYRLHGALKRLRVVTMKGKPRNAHRQPTLKARLARL